MRQNQDNPASRSFAGERRKRFGQVSACALLALTFGAVPAHADPLGTPAMSASLSANQNPIGFDFDDAGKIYVGGAVSGLAYYQDNPNFGVHSQLDLSNGQAWVEKTDGWWQFYVQAGMYSLPSLGTGYVKSSVAPNSAVRHCAGGLC